MGDADPIGILLGACGGRDEVAFERLYRLAAPRLFAMCIAMLRREDQAEDVLQEAFVQIWRDAGRFDPARGSAMAWMGTITRHRALDALRARRAPGVPLDVDRRVAPEADPVRELLDGAARDDLERCLRGLTDEQRQSISLAFFRGLTHGELADALATPVGTVKSWIRRGLAALRRCLEP